MKDIRVLETVIPGLHAILQLPRSLVILPHITAQPILTTFPQMEKEIGSFITILFFSSRFFKMHKKTFSYKNMDRNMCQ